MFHYSLIFLVVALVAALLGFGVLVGVSATLTKICFVGFLVLFFSSATRDSSRHL